MRIQILDEAEEDLQDGREFYDRQESGVRKMCLSPFTRFLLRASSRIIPYI